MSSAIDPIFVMLASLISKLPVTSKSPPTDKFPAAVTFAPLKVNAVVVPDLIIKFPDVFVALPKVVPASLKNTSPPSASKIISVVASKVKSPELVKVSEEDEEISFMFVPSV